MFYDSLELAISSKSIRQYTRIAYRHLSEQGYTISVACAGSDAEGNTIFGIQLVSEDGREEWYDPQEDNSSTLLGWDDEDDAISELENKVLPQIGYAIHQKDLHLFHKFMGDLNTII